MIRFTHVGCEFARPTMAAVWALRDVDLHVRRGETLCLVGPSGCGKTTLLRLVNALEHATHGHVSVAGRAVGDWDPIRLRRSIGYVMQNGGLFPHMTVAANVSILMQSEGVPLTRVGELLERVHLDPERFGERYPAELSGGERQRVGVARALALDPDVLLMDEPFGALDPLTRRALQDEFATLSRELGKTILLVSHDLEEAFLLGNRVAVMAQGRVEQVGTEHDLRTQPASEFVSRFVGETRHA